MYVSVGSLSPNQLFMFEGAIYAKSPTLLQPKDPMLTRIFSHSAYQEGAWFRKFGQGQNVNSDLQVELPTVSS